MANEILIVKIHDMGDEGEDFECIFLYALPAPIVVNSIVVVETPSSSLPQQVLDHNMLTAPELAALDSGDAIFEDLLVKNRTGLSPPEVLSKARGMYNAAKITRIANLIRRYELSGVRFDAVV